MSENTVICPYVDQTRTVKATHSNYVHEIENTVNCTSSNIIYCITCLQCNAQYIGESEKSLAVRFGQHKGYVRNKKLDQATGFHFNQRGHDVADMQVLIIEKIHSTDGAFRKEREKMYINLFNTSYRGINKQL